jgi:hypothetical protein
MPFFGKAFGQLKTATTEQLRPSFGIIRSSEAEQRAHVQIMKRPRPEPALSQSLDSSKSKKHKRAIIDTGQALSDLEQLFSIPPRRATKPTLSGGDAAQAKSRNAWRINHRKRALVTEVNRVLPKFSKHFQEFLKWAQTKQVFGALTDGLGLRINATQQKIVSNVTYLLDNIGHSSKKAATALLFRGITPAEARPYVGKQSYSSVQKALQTAGKRKYDPSKSRLVTDDYTRGTKRRKLPKPFEEAHREWAKTVLGSKSGSRTADRFYRYRSWDKLYHEVYRPNFHAVLKIFCRNLESSGECIANLAAKQTRLGQNVKLYLTLGKNAPIASLSKECHLSGSESDSEAHDHQTSAPSLVPALTSSSSSAVTSSHPDSSSTESSSSSSYVHSRPSSAPSKKRKGSCLRPLSQSVFRRVLKYDRATKEGIKITFVQPKICDSCRKLPITRRKIKILNDELAMAREAGENCTEFETQLNTLEIQLTRLERHEKWLAIQRPFIEAIQAALSWGEAPQKCICVQDFGGFYNSRGSKIKSLSLSIFDNAPDHLACGDSFIRYVDNWFRGSSRGTTAVRIWEFIFKMTSVFENVDHVYVVGDTGNGFRGYELFDFFSTVRTEFNKCIEYIPYCPDHAQNQTDRHISHLADKIDAIKHSGRIIGLNEFADVGTQVTNTEAFVHDDGLDGKIPAGFSHVEFPDLSHEIPDLVRQAGIRTVGHAQFEWKLPNGDLFSSPGACRIQEFAGENKWVYWDLRQKGACLKCSSRDRQPVHHGDQSECVYLRRSSKNKKSEAGIKVIMSLLTMR